MSQSIFLERHKMIDCSLKNKKRKKTLKKIIIPLKSMCVRYCSHKRIWPVERALVIHNRSRVLKGTSTKLTLAARFLALSGYMKWCVVRLPASSSYPTVGARFILEHTDPIELDREKAPSLSLKRALLLWHFIIFPMTG